MRYGVEDAMKKFPDAKDIFVICDGDVTPFSAAAGRYIAPSECLPHPYDFNKAKGDLISWESFIKRYDHDVKFNFIALSKSADNLEMKRMSEIANGVFTSSI